jgi:hypothetical protein
VVHIPSVGTYTVLCEELSKDGWDPALKVKQVVRLSYQIS